MNQFRRRLFPLCAFRSRISPSFEKFADFAVCFSRSFEKLAISRRVFSGRLKGSQISRISQISRGVFRLADFADFERSRLSRLSRRFFFELLLPQNHNNLDMKKECSVWGTPF